MKFVDAVSNSHVPSKVSITCTRSHKVTITNQRTNGPVNAHWIPLPSKAQNIQNLENIW